MKFYRDGKTSKCLVFAIVFAWLLLTISSLAVSADDKMREDRVKELLALSEEHDIKAQFELAEAYTHGKGIRRDTEQALIWYAKAFMRGSLPAMLGLKNLGDCEKSDSLEKLSETTIERARNGSDEKLEAIALVASLFLSGKTPEQTQTEQKLRRALEIVQKHNDRVAEGMILIMTAGMHLDAKEHKKAQPVLERASEIAADTNNTNLIFWTKFVEGFVEKFGPSDTPSKPEVLQKLLDALRITQDTEDFSSQAIVLQVIAAQYRKQEEITLKQDYLRQALLAAEKTDSYRLQVEIIGELADSAFGRDEGAEYAEKAVALVRANGDDCLEGIYLSKLAWSLFYCGQIERSLNASNQGLELATKTNDIASQLGTLSSMAFHSIVYGKYQIALDAYEKLYDLAKAAKGSLLIDYEKDALRGKAAVYRKLGRWTAAREIYEKFFPSSIAIISFYREQGKFDKAVEKVKEGLGAKLDEYARRELVQELFNTFVESGNLKEADALVENYGAETFQSKWLARLHYLKGDFDKAKQYYVKMRPEDHKMWFVESSFVYYTGLGTVYEALEDYKKAAEHYEEAMNLVEEMRAGLAPAERKNFFEVRISGFPRSAPAQGLTRVRMKMNEGAQSIDSSEVTRARAFADGLWERAGMDHFGVPEEILKKEEQLGTTVAILRKSRSEKTKDEDSRRYANLTRRIDDAEKELSDFIEMLWKDHKEYAAVKYPRLVTLKQSALKPDERVVIFDVSDEGVGIKLVKGKEIVETYYQKWKNDDLENAVLKFRKAFDAVNLGAYDPELGKMLYKRLLGRILMEVPEGTPVTIIPDGILAVLPFEALVVEGRAKWRKSGDTPVPEGLTYVADVYPISYYQSITAMTLARTLGKQNRPGQKRLVIADPVFTSDDARLSGMPESKKAQLSAPVSGTLTSMKTELGLTFERAIMTGELADSLKKMDPEKTDSYTGFDAAKSLLFQKQLDIYGSMVFATHGYFGKDIPGIQEPVLVLTLVGQPAGKDGFLRMTEVMGLKLNAELVALTACQTGLGRAISGEGTMNMGRAFQYAGAKSVLMTLWSVEQTASVKLVESFFRHLKEGKGKLEALTLARNEIRKEGFDHPFFWAPFILVGEVN